MQDNSPKMPYINNHSHNKIKSLSIRTDDSSLFNYSVNQNAQNTPSSNRGLGQIAPMSTNDLLSPKRNTKNSQYNFTNLLNSINSVNAPSPGSMSGLQSPNNRVSMGGYSKNILSSMTEVSSPTNLPLLRQTSQLPGSYNQLDQEIENLEKKIKIRKLKSKLQEQEEEDDDSLEKKKKERAKKMNFGKMLSRIMIDESDEDDNSNATSERSKDEVDALMEKLKIGKASSLSHNPIQQAITQMTKLPQHQPGMSMNTLPSQPLPQRQRTIINVVPRSYQDLDRAPIGNGPRPMINPGMINPQYQQHQMNQMQQQQMMMQQQQHHQQMYNNMQMQHNQGHMGQGNSNMPPMMSPQSNLLKPHAPLVLPNPNNFHNNNAGSPSSKTQHQRTNTFHINLKPSYMKSAENNTSPHPVSTNERNGNQSVRPVNTEPLESPKQRNDQYYNYKEDPMKAPIKEEKHREHKEHKEHKESKPMKESVKDSHKETIQHKELFKDKEEAKPLPLFDTTKKKHKITVKLLGKYEPKKLLRAYLWGMLYVFLLKNSAKKIVLKKRQKTMIELPKKIDLMMDGYIKKLVDKETADEIFKILSAKNYDFAFVKRLKENKDSSRDNDYEEKFAVDPRIAYDPFFKHMQVILDKITTNTKKLPDEFFRMISTLTENGAHLPNKYFTHFELCRLPFSAFGALKGVKAWHSKVLIGGLVVVRMFIIGIIMKHILVIPYIKENKEVAMVVGSVMYQCTMDHLRSLAGINYDTDKTVITGLKVAPMSKLETPLSETEMQQYPTKKNKQAVITDIIEGFYTKDMMPFLFKERTRMIEVIKSLIAGWIELIYERSHQIWQEDQEKKESALRH